MNRLQKMYQDFRRAAPRWQLQVIALLMAAMIASAFVIEYGFKAEPCHLCWLQRYGHWAMLAVALVGAALPRAGQVMALRAVFITALYGFVMGGYHSLVQGKYIAGPSGCSGPAAMPTSIEDFNKFLDNPSLPPRCDEVSFAVFGVSLPIWNMLASAVVMYVVYDILRHRRRKKEAENK